MANFLSKERRAGRRAVRAARRAERASIRRAKLALKEVRLEHRLSETRRRLTSVAGAPAERGAAPGGHPYATAGLRTHAEPHGEPSHHVGTCDAACRAGMREHEHRRE